MIPVDPMFYNNACGGFNNFVSDYAQTTNYIAPSDKDGSEIEVSVNDVTRFAAGNIVEMKGDVYSGNFEISRVWKRSDGGGNIFLKTKYLFSSPTSIKDAAWNNGYVDRSVHTVINLTMFAPLVLQYSELIKNTKGKKSGGKDQSVFDDVKWWQWASGATIVWDKVVDGEGILQVAYRRLKAGGNKGTYSVAEMKYLQAAANTAISTINNNQTRKRAQDFMNKKFMKLQDSSALMPSTTTNEAGVPTIPTPTGNQTTIAQSGKTGSTSTTASTGLSAISSSNIIKYVFGGVAVIGSILLVRSFIKKS